jgi:hypothetical protein
MESNGLIVGKKGLYIILFVNSFLAIADRLTQILFCALTTHINSTVFNACIAFIIIKTCGNIFMIIIYLLVICDPVVSTNE